MKRMPKPERRNPPPPLMILPSTFFPSRHSSCPRAAVIVPFKLLTPNELIDLKENLLNVAAAALISAPKVEITNPTIIRITRLVKSIAYYDPVFVLKVALYLRLDLNIRSTANYVLALASNIKECQPYVLLSFHSFSFLFFRKNIDLQVRHYFPHSVRLPSDWLDVAATYQILPDRQLGGKVTFSLSLSPSLFSIC